MDLFINDAWFEEFFRPLCRGRGCGGAAVPGTAGSQAAGFRAVGCRARHAADHHRIVGTWFYADHPKLDCGWLLKWAEWSVEAAIANGMRGWTPHNYTMPQFVNWQDVAWHRRLTNRFLNT